MYANFDNLFGDPVLSEGTNKFLNENWRTVFFELKPVIEKQIGLIIKDLLNNVFNKLPYKDFFLE